MAERAFFSKEQQDSVVFSGCWNMNHRRLCTDLGCSWWLPSLALRPICRFTLNQSLLTRSSCAFGFSAGENLISESALLAADALAYMEFGSGFCSVLWIRAQVTHRNKKRSKNKDNRKGKVGRVKNKHSGIWLYHIRRIKLYLHGLHVYIWT